MQCAEPASANSGASCFVLPKCLPPTRGRRGRFCHCPHRRRPRCRRGKGGGLHPGKNPKHRFVRCCNACKLRPEFHKPPAYCLPGKGPGCCNNPGTAPCGIFCFGKPEPTPPTQAHKKKPGNEYHSCIQNNALQKCWLCILKSQAAPLENSKKWHVAVSNLCRHGEVEGAR